MKESISLEEKSTDGAMDPRRDIDVSGNRVVNVADPSLSHHVATKNYADLLHERDPTTNKEEYVRYINLRTHTAHSIVVLCDISLNWVWTTKHEGDTVGPHILLESATSTSSLHFGVQDLKDKFMTVKYEHPVTARQWQILLNHEGEKDPEFKLKCVWQFSDDGQNWHIVLHNMEIKMKEINWSGNDAELIFHQPHHQDPHLYWQIFITEGEVK